MRLLQHKAEVHAQDAASLTPLHLACSRLHQNGIGLLLRWSADETNVDDFGLTGCRLVGDAIRNENERQARARDLQRMRKLLTRTPADRAWHRRGLLLLCRAFLDKARPLAMEA